MSVKPTKTPQIPVIPKDAPKSMKRWMESVKEVIEVREGTRGQDLDKSVTFRDLVDAGVDISPLGIKGAPTSMPGDGGDQPDTSPVPPWTPPPGMIDPLPYQPVPMQPTGLSASGGVGIVWVSWDNPQTLYRNHRLTEVWRAESTHNFNHAALIGTSPDGRYIDRIDDSGGKTYYYLVRFVTLENKTGPYAGPVTGSNVYEVLRNSILESHLIPSLTSKIDTASDNATEAKGVTDDLYSQYTIKTQYRASDGTYYIAGMGLIVEEQPNGEVKRRFIVDVDEFAIIDSTGNAGDIQTPFMVGDVNGKKVVIIKDAAIGDATITSAKIAELDAGKIVTGTISADNSIRLSSGRFVIETFRKAGQNNAHLVVYDNNGTPRVQLGCSTSGAYNEDGFGLWVWDKNGNPQFDANGARVKIDQAFINDLWIAGQKATVPQGSFTKSFIHVNLDPGENVLLQQMSFNPQGCANIMVQMGFGYDFVDPFEVPEHMAGTNIIVSIRLYAPWSSAPIFQTEIAMIVCQFEVMGEDLPPQQYRSSAYISPEFVIPWDYRNIDCFFRMTLYTQWFDMYGNPTTARRSTRATSDDPIQLMKRIKNRSLLVCGLRS